LISNDLSPRDRTDNEGERKTDIVRAHRSVGVAEVLSEGSTRQDEFTTDQSARTRRVGSVLRLSQLSPWRSTGVREVNAGCWTSLKRQVAYSGEFSKFCAESANCRWSSWWVSAKSAGLMQTLFQQNSVVWAASTSATNRDDDVQAW